MTKTTPERYAVGKHDVEAEHAMQYQLLAEMERLLAAGDLDAARIVLEQFHVYTEAHFGSEEVLMRQHSYPGYDAHVNEHGELLEVLAQLEADLDEKKMMSTSAAIRRWLTSHIHHADEAFVEHIRTSPLQPREPEQT